MRQFTGGEPITGLHLERDEAFPIERPEGVQSLRLLTSHGVTGSTRCWKKAVE